MYAAYLYASVALCCHSSF